MSRRQGDGFNFVGLTHSPVKQTPRKRSHVRGESDTKDLAGEPLFTARNVVDGSDSSSSRTALQTVSNNVLGTPTVDKVDAGVSTSSGLLSSSTSGIKGEPVRSRVPVSRTLRLSRSADKSNMVGGASGVTAPGLLIDNLSENAWHESASEIHRRDENRGFPDYSRGSHGRFAAPTPSSTKIARTKIQHQQSSSTSSHPPLSLGADVRQRASAEYQPETPIAEEPCMSSSPWLGSCTHGSDDSKWSDSLFSNAMFSPVPATPVAASAETISGTRNGRSGEYRAQGGPALESGSREENTCRNHTPFSQSSLRRAGSTPLHAPSSNDRSLAGSTALHDNPEYTLLSVGTNIGSSDPRSILQRSACGEELDGEVKLDTPTAAATLAAMMVGGNGPATIPPVMMDVSEEEDGYSDEARDLFPEEPSQISMHVDHQARSTDTVPEFPHGSEAGNIQRSTLTPRRPIAASALLELRGGTPRGMIRGIIGGVAQSGRLRQQQQQQQHFESRVATVDENVEETPRRFIKAVLASSNNNPIAAVTNEITAAPIINSSGGQSISASVAAAAAATEAAAKAAATVAAATVPENAEPRRSIAAPVEETPAPVAESSVTVSPEGNSGVGLVASVGNIGGALFNTVLFINAVAFLLVLIIVLMALMYQSFADHNDNALIY